MKLGKQLFLILGAATMLPMVLLWFWLSDAMYQQKVAEVHERHLLIAKNLLHALDRYHTDVITGFEVVADNLVAGNKISNVDKIIENLEFRHFCVANFTTGRVVASAGPKDIPCLKVIPAKRFHQLKSILKGSQTVISPVWQGPHKKPIIYVVKKIRNTIAVGALNTKYIVNLGKAVSFGEMGHAAIVDQEGNVLSHPKADWIAARKNIAKVSAVKKMLAGKTGVQTFFSPALKADMIAGYSGTKTGSWSVMVPQPVAELAAAATQARGALFPALALLIVAVGLVATIAAQLTLRPLRQVIKGVEDLASGKEVAALDESNWKVPKEYQELQNRFNLMAKTVKNYQKQQRRDKEVAKKESQGNVEYLANLAHELKTPLNSILGFSSVLKQAKPGALKPTEQNEFLGHIEKSAGHMLGFVNDLLDLNRLDMGARSLEFEPMYLIEPIRFCEATLRKTMAEKSITLNIDCENRDIKINADERSINQIMINLVSNAVRYSLDNSVVSITVMQQQDGDVEISVLDNGIGIPEEDLETIMQPFKRSSDPQIAEIHGTGLGLSIVKRLAALHQIEFSIASEHGFNTTATLIIPKARIVMQKSSKSAA